MPMNNHEEKEHISTPKKVRIDLLPYRVVLMDEYSI